MNQVGNDDSLDMFTQISTTQLALADMYIGMVALISSIVGLIDSIYVLLYV